MNLPLKIFESVGVLHDTNAGDGAVGRWRSLHHRENGHLMQFPSRSQYLAFLRVLNCADRCSVVFIITSIVRDD